VAAATYESCSSTSRGHAIEQLGALACATTAEMLEVVVAADHGEDWRVDGALDMASWLTATLKLSHATARAWVRVGHALEALPHLRACFAAGELSWDQIAAATRFATPELDEVLADELLGLSAAQIETLARDRRRRTRRDAQRTGNERHLRWRKDHDLDGYRYSGFLPAVEGELVNACLERRAAQVGKDPVTEVWAPLEQRAADAFVDMARQELTVDPGPDPTIVVVHVDAESLDAEDGNGSVNGVQVASDTVRRLLCDAKIEGNVEGPDGTCIGIGRVDRNPPRWLRRRIHHRDQHHCRFPGCGRRIRQIHHLEWWERDCGPTDSWNLVGLCWQHHHLVHEGGWTIAGTGDHRLTFISPLGRKLTSRPPPLLPDTRARAQEATGFTFGERVHATGPVR